MSRDPAEEEGGENLYFVGKNSCINNKDGLGLKVTSYAAAIRYRVGIDLLDFFTEDEGYSKTAKLRHESFPNFPNNIIVPPFSSAGPAVVKNEAFIHNVPGTTKDTMKGIMINEVYGIAYYLFFVDFDVCFDKESDIRVILRETEILNTICTFDIDGNNPVCTPEKGIDRRHELRPTSTPQKPGYMISKSRTGGDGASHRVILCDAPFTSMQAFKAIAELGIKKKYSTVSAKQEVTLEDTTTGLPVFSISHSFSVGINQEGNLSASP